jgi:DsbC/DsbD-like thiol-disulfide interchange protein
MAASLYLVAEPSASKPRARDKSCVRRAMVAIAWAVAACIAPVHASAAGPSVETAWKVEKGSATEAVLTITIEKGWHVNANDPDRPFLIPTTLEVADAEKVGVASIRYPDAVVHGLAFAPGTPLRLYEGTFAIRVRLAAEVPQRFDANLAFQACSDETCLPPRTLAVPFDASKAAR